MAETLPTCAERLAAARLRYHNLQMEQQEAGVTYGDRSVQYQRIQNQIGEARIYIRELEQECGDCTKRRRPFGMAW